MLIFDDLPLLERDCYIAAAKTALLVADKGLPWKNEYRHGRVAVEIPMITGRHSQKLEYPRHYAVVWAKYFALEKVSKPDNYFREFNITARLSSDPSWVFACVLFKKQGESSDDEREMQFESRDVEIAPPDIRSPIGNQSLTGTQTTGISTPEPVENDQVGVPRGIRPTWSHDWIEPAIAVSERSFYMALLTLPCVVVLRRGDEPIQSFDTYGYPYKMGVVDESHPPGVVNLTCAWALKMVARAVAIGAARQQLALLTLTVQ